jgi:hypothetical protein
MKLSTCLIKHCGTKAYVEAEVYLHAFLTSVLNGGVSFTLRHLYARGRKEGPEDIRVSLNPTE